MPHLATISHHPSLTLPSHFHTTHPSHFLHTSFRYDMVHSQHFGDAIRNTVVWRYLVLDEGHKVWT